MVAPSRCDRTRSDIGSSRVLPRMVPRIREPSAPKLHGASPVRNRVTARPSRSLELRRWSTEQSARVGGSAAGKGAACGRLHRRRRLRRVRRADVPRRRRAVGGAPGRAGRDAAGVRRRPRAGVAGSTSSALQPGAAAGPTRRTQVLAAWQRPLPELHAGHPERRRAPRGRRARATCCTCTARSGRVRCTRLRPRAARARRAASGGAAALPGRAGRWSARASCGSARCCPRTCSRPPRVPPPAPRSCWWSAPPPSSTRRQGWLQIAASAGAAVIEVNPEASALAHLADVVLRGPAGELLPRLDALLGRGAGMSSRRPPRGRAPAREAARQGRGQPVGRRAAGGAAAHRAGRASRCWSWRAAGSTTRAVWPAWQRSISPSCAGGRRRAGQGDGRGGGARARPAAGARSRLRGALAPRPARSWRPSSSAGATPTSGWRCSAA